MLKEFKGAKDEDSAALKAEIKALRERLLAQQQLVRDQKLPIIVLVEGWAAAGKGSLINELISEIDPRFRALSLPVSVCQGDPGERQDHVLRLRLDGGRGAEVPPP